MIAYVRREAWLNERVEGSPRRQHFAVVAKRNPEVRALLEGPDCPESLEYLYEWATALCGRSGVGMDGYAPLSYSTVAAWADLMGIAVEPQEVEGLMMLDAVIRHPGEPEKDGG